jgi:hypothetical protein
MFKHQQIFSQDPAKFSHRERQLRDYHLRNWLKMNRSTQELLELSLNHFYGEQPKLLGWSLNIIDGDPRGLVVAAIMRESGANAAQAELLYEQLQSRIVQCRSLVAEVTSNARFSPDNSRRMLQERVARAGVIRPSTMPSPQIVIVNRPALITSGAALLLMSAAMTILFIVVEFPGMEKFHQLVGAQAGITLSIFFSALCAWGYWNMKRWAVVLCVIEPLMRLLVGMPHSVIAMPLLVAAFGIMHWGEMSWQ